MHVTIVFTVATFAMAFGFVLGAIVASTMILTED